MCLCVGLLGLMGKLLEVTSDWKEQTGSNVSGLRTHLPHLGKEQAHFSSLRFCHVCLKHDVFD
jgi:hypothetical protein